jgi:hypothetical protein
MDEIADGRWKKKSASAEGNRDHPQLAQNSYFETQISIN